MKKEMKIWKVISIVSVLACAGSFTACAKDSQINAKPVESFKVERYLGNWYEIGRFDFKWEKNMSNVVAKYSLNADGTITVTNTGYDYVRGEVKQSVGKAKFATKDTSVGDLKVSFFGPFYSSYRIIALDPDYHYALVAGDNSGLLWILSRFPKIPDDVKDEFIQIARSSGYDMSDFVWTVHK